MTKGNGGNGDDARGVTVTVTPQVTNGTDVECNFDGTPVTDDAIFLDLNQAYDITFNLADGPGGSYSFHPSKPFCNQAKHCPPELPGGSAHTPYSVTSNGGNTITIHVDRVPARAVAHYRLNFNGGCSCDPIIIHD
jgi:hypothetical protein